MNGFEILCKLGGYIMLFSILLEQITFYVPQKLLQLPLCISLEVTNGIRQISEEALSPQLGYALILIVVPFLFALDYYTEKHRECGIESGAADRESQVSVIKDRPAGVYREQYSLQ